MKKDIRGGRILITQPILHSFCGSTVVTIELARYFKKMGAEVDIYSYTFEEPVKTELSEGDIRVYMAQNAGDLDIFDYDYIWIHSQVFPERMTSQLSELHKKKKRPYFIFLHMSPHDYIPDEFQWIYNFEDKIADLVLYISEETKKCHDGIFTESVRDMYFRNPCPKDYVLNTTPKKLKRILVVSNHAPVEVEEAAIQLIKKGITVDHLGAKGNKQKLITPEDIQGYDAVVTIGKTVQYCILSKRPVYIYDIFGGPGFLTYENYKKNKEYNFSGRGYNKKSALEIVNEIIGEWSKAKNNIIKIHKEYSHEYILDDIIPEIFSGLAKRSISAFSFAQQKSIYYAQRLAQYRFQEAYSAQSKDKEIERLRKKDADNNLAMRHLNQLYAPNIFIRVGRKINYNRFIKKK